jgi:transketolase
VVVLVGDAELDEGANYEAIAYAGATGLDSLTVVAIDNQSARYRWPGVIAERFAVNGWFTSTVDGRDHDALELALSARPGRPNVVVAELEPKG